MKLSRLAVAASLALGAGMLAGQTAWAEDHGHEMRAEGHAFHGEISRFHEHDWGVWRGGHWEHVMHGGRLGWWWIAGGLWYFYPSPVYPYPDPYEPPAAVIVTPPPPPADAPPPPQPRYWYFCDSARGYYPYVTACPEGWRTVPAR